MNGVWGKYNNLLYSMTPDTTRLLIFFLWNETNCQYLPYSSSEESYNTPMQVLSIKEHVYHITVITACSAIVVRDKQSTHSLFP